MSPSSCPRCSDSSWNDFTYCVRCGLVAPGVHPDSPLGQSGKRVEERWLHRDKNEKRAEQFRLSDAGKAYAVAPPSPGLPAGAVPRPASARKPPLVSALRCTLLGGAIWPLPVNAYCDLMFRAERIEVLLDAAAVVTLDYSEVSSLDVGGPGVVTKGGGFFGGGFGLEGAAIGMLEAGILNALTTRRRVLSVINLQAGPAEGFFLYEGAAPDELRIRLSPVFGRMRATRRMPDTPKPQSSRGEDVADRLAQLGAMVERGLLTDEEFDKLKAELLHPDE